MGRAKDFAYERNKNILVVGGSGSGKTRFFAKPNIMQMHSSYVITDPKGTIVEECGQMLLDAGYKLKLFNTIDFPKSLHYNPFQYIKTETDILKLVKTIITNTKGEGQTGGDDFWEKAEELYYMALIGYIHYELDEDERNFATLVKMVNMSEARENDENFKNVIDLAFESLETGMSPVTKIVNGKEEVVYDEKGNPVMEVVAEPQPNHFAVLQYKKYKLAAGKTAKSILISCGARLAPFDIDDLRRITMYDELELDKLGGYMSNPIQVDKENLRDTDEIVKGPDKKDGKYIVKRLRKHKTALFVIISDTDATFNFIVSIMYTQMFNLLCTIADNEYGGKLPVPVRCILDEFANIGKIPQFEKLIATIRSREISAAIILQSRAQLKALYKDHTETIIGNCDSELFLGGKEEVTLKSLSEMLGKETIYHTTNSETRSNQNSFGRNEQKIGRELLQTSEIARIPNKKCILMIRGEKPFYSDKFDITKHKHYKKLSDYDKKNHLDVKKYIKNYDKIIGKELEQKRNTKLIVVNLEA